jgi:hypothetical protein
MARPDADSLAAAWSGWHEVPTRGRKPGKPRTAGWIAGSFLPLQSVEKRKSALYTRRIAMLRCFCITAVLTRQTEGLLNILVPPEFLSRNTSDERSIN